MCANMRGQLQIWSTRLAWSVLRAVRPVLRPVWRRFRPSVFIWLDTGLTEVRTGLQTEGIEARSRLADPPYATRWLTGLVAARLAMQHATCLERSVIMQRWLLVIGRPHDLLIGVRSPRETTIAHAWLDHESSRGHYVLLRLPHELRQMFEDWLATHFPDRAKHVLSLIRETRGGALSEPSSPPHQGRTGKRSAENRRPRQQRRHVRPQLRCAR